MWKSKWVLGAAAAIAVVGGYFIVDALRSPSPTAVDATQPVTESTAKRDVRSATPVTNDLKSDTAVAVAAKPATPATESPGTSRPSAPVAPSFDPSVLRKVRVQAAATDAPGVPGDTIAKAERALASGDHETASKIAGKALDVVPGDTRMRRVAVQASCMKGDAAAASEHNAKLPLVEQKAMLQRCREHGTSITLGGGARTPGGE
jgi:hypothetical protein